MKRRTLVQQSTVFAITIAISLLVRSRRLRSSGVMLPSSSYFDAFHRRTWNIILKLSKISHVVILDRQQSTVIVWCNSCNDVEREVCLGIESNIPPTQNTEKMEDFANDSGITTTETLKKCKSYKTLVIFISCQWILPRIISFNCVTTIAAIYRLQPPRTAAANCSMWKPCVGSTECRVGAGALLHRDSEFIVS